MKKFFKGIYATVCVGFIAWFGLSVLEVMCNNLNPDYQYCALNIFKVLMGV